MTNDFTVIFAPMGSTHIKAAHKTLMKLTPGVNFIIILCAALMLIDPKMQK